MLREAKSNFPCLRTLKIHVKFADSDSCVKLIEFMNDVKLVAKGLYFHLFDCADHILGEFIATICHDRMLSTLKSAKFVNCIKEHPLYPFLLLRLPHMVNLEKLTYVNKSGDMVNINRFLFDDSLLAIPHLSSFSLLGANNDTFVPEAGTKPIRGNYICRFSELFALSAIA